MTSPGNLRKVSGHFPESQTALDLGGTQHGYPKTNGYQNVALGNLQKCVGGFLLYKFWRILPGIFLEDFSGHFLPTKMRRKNPARKSAKESGGSKKKSAKNPFCRKPA